MVAISVSVIFIIQLNCKFSQIRTVKENMQCEPDLYTRFQISRFSYIHRFLIGFLRGHIRLLVTTASDGKR